MGGQLIHEIGAFSFVFYKRYGSEYSDGYHELYLNELETWLKAKGFETARERSTVYEHVDRKGGTICSKRGMVDLYAKGRDHKVAVEFDNGKRLKFKSIEKMNNSDADILVGVITGGPDNKGIKINLQRYRDISTNNPSVNRDIWLIVLSESRIELMSARDNTSFGSRSISAKVDDGSRIGQLMDRKRHGQRAIDDY